VLHSDERSREWRLVGFLSRTEQKSSQRVGKEKLRELHRMRDQSLERLILAEEGEEGEGEVEGVGEADEGSESTHTCDVIDDGTNVNVNVISSNMTPITPRRRHRLLVSPDFESTMYFSLSLEDHSGASSTCFAHCCANATPFARQRQQQQHQTTYERSDIMRTRRSWMKKSHGHDAGVVENEEQVVMDHAINGCRSHPGGGDDAGGAGTVGALSSSTRFMTDATPLSMKKRVVARRHTEMNRRHSIDGVGLHTLGVQVTNGKNTNNNTTNTTNAITTDAYYTTSTASYNHTSTPSAINVALASPKTPLSSPMYMMAPIVRRNDIIDHGDDSSSTTNMVSSSSESSSSTCESSSSVTSSSTSSSLAQLLSSPCALPLPSFVYPLICDSRSGHRSRRRRAQSICDGELCIGIQYNETSSSSSSLSSSSSSECAHTLCFSPTRRQQSQCNDSLNETIEVTRMSQVIDAPS